MNTKIVYVLVSDTGDYYLEQTFLSIYSLRIHNPSAHVSLLIDDTTNSSLTNFRCLLIELVDEIIVVDLDDNLSKKIKSRWLKTSMRHYIKGNFLFIDSDTIITSTLNSIDRQEHSICAAKDCHLSLKTHPGKNRFINSAHTIGFLLEKEFTYFNSGVLFVKDNKEANDFFTHWHKNWEKGVDRGIIADQPSFAKSNFESGHIIFELEGHWNCHALYGLRFLKNAHIIHYYASNIDQFIDAPFLLMQKEVLYSIRSLGYIPETIKNKIKYPIELYNNKTLIIGNEDIDFFHSRIVKLSRFYFYKRKRLFNVFERILSFGSKLQFSRKYKSLK